MSKHTLLLAKNARRIGLWIQVAVIVLAGTLPLAISSSASAATTQLNTRSVTSTTGVPGAATNLVFTFNTTTKGATNVKQIELEFCDSPLGACLITQTPTIAASPTVTLGGTWAGSGLTTTRVNSRSTPASTNTQVNVVITTPANEDNKTLVVNLTSSVTNFGTANKSYYPRIRLYSDTGTTLEWYGSVAQSTSQTLTVNARVQEILSFCVGSTLVDDLTTSIAADCSGVTGTSVDLGVVSSGAINVTPVNATNGGDLKNAVAMVQTNAVNGVTIAYKAIQDTSSGKLKVVGASCSGTTVTDQCFNSAGTTQTTFTAGTEEFGMTIAGINCASVPGSAYSCDYTTGLTNLQPQTNYIGGTYVHNTSGTYGTGTGYAWDDTGTAQTIASSASSGVKVVADEALVLKFAATAGITTPTGQYQTQADFIATPTY